MSKYLFALLVTPSVRFGEDPPPPKDPPKDPPKTYTQEEFDRHAAVQRRAYEKSQSEYAKKLEGLSNNQNLTQQERDQARQEAEDIRKQFMSSEETAKQEQKRLKDAHEAETKRLKDERDSYKTRHDNMLIENELTKHLSAEEQVSGQLIRYFRPDTVLVDELGDDKKPTGKQVVKINFEDTDASGSPVKLTLSVSDTVKRIKELPERFSNMLKGSGSGGVGGSNANKTHSGVKPKDTASYMAQRRAERKNQ